MKYGRAYGPNPQRSLKALAECDIIAPLGSNRDFVDVS